MSQHREDFVFDLLTSDPSFIDVGLFELWTQGKTEEEAAATVLPDSCLSDDVPDIDKELFCSPRFARYREASVRHQYHFFIQLSEKLERPMSLEIGLELHVPLSLIHDLVRIFYAFDDSIARQLVGKKLTTGTKKTVEAMAEAAAIPVVSCLRQFDNFRNVCSCLDAEFLTVSIGSPRAKKRTVEQFLCDTFQFSKEMASRYARFWFLGVHKMRLTARPFDSIPFSAVEELAAALVDVWADKASFDLVIDFAACKEIKGVMRGQAEAKYLEAIKEAIVRNDFVVDGVSGSDKRIFGIVPALVRSLFDVAISFADGKEWGKILEDIKEDIVNPLVHVGVGLEASRVLFDTVGSVDVKTFSRSLSASHSENWAKFLGGVLACVAVFLRGVSTP